MIGGVRTGKNIIAGMLVTFVLLRTLLFISPESDFYIAGYNIHHLFAGLVITIVFVLPLIILRPAGRTGVWLARLFGAGIGMMLDEGIYLIATDASNASYLLPISFWGGFALIVICAAYLLALMGIEKRRHR